MTAQTPAPRSISIHAPREGGDDHGHRWYHRFRYFNPRPPRGGRRLALMISPIKKLFQSTPPARGATSCFGVIPVIPTIFQSTPPARGATRPPPAHSRRTHYFNPRPPRGGRRAPQAYTAPATAFQSTPPARGATRPVAGDAPGHGISIHAPREGGDTRRTGICWELIHFNPRPPRGGRP